MATKAEKEEVVEEEVEEEIYCRHERLGLCRYLGDGPKSYSSPHVVVLSVGTKLMERVPRSEVEFVDAEEKEEEKQVYSCKKHPNYQAMRRPRSGCRQCIAAYLAANPDKR